MVIAGAMAVILFAVGVLVGLRSEEPDLDEGGADKS